MSYLLDTGYLYGLLDNQDTHHQAILNSADEIDGIIYLPTVVTTEVAYLLLKYLGVSALIEFLDILADGQFQMVEPLPIDYKRASAIVAQYQDSNIDFVDAVIVAIAERINVARILTIDQRHFRMFRPKHCDAFEIVP